MNGGNGTKVLVRDRKGRMVAGVCAGVAQYFGLDVTLVRVIVAVVSVITGGAGVLAYLAAWVIIPGEGETTSIARESHRREAGRLIRPAAVRRRSGCHPFYAPRQPRWRSLVILSRCQRLLWWVPARRASRSPPRPARSLLPGCRRRAWC